MRVASSTPTFDCYNDADHDPMPDSFKYYAVVFLALQAVIDLTLTGLIYYQVGKLVPLGLIHGKATL